MISVLNNQIRIRRLRFQYWTVSSLDVASSVFKFTACPDLAQLSLRSSIRRKRRKSRCSMFNFGNLYLLPHFKYRVCIAINILHQYLLLTYFNSRIGRLWNEDIVLSRSNFPTYAHHNTVCYRQTTNPLQSKEKIELTVPEVE